MRAETGSVEPTMAEARTRDENEEVGCGGVVGRPAAETGLWTIRWRIVERAEIGFARENLHGYAVAEPREQRACEVELAHVLRRARTPENHARAGRPALTNELARLHEIGTRPRATRARGRRKGAMPSVAREVRRQQLACGLSGVRAAEDANELGPVDCVAHGLARAGVGERRHASVQEPEGRARSGRGVNLSRVLRLELRQPGAECGHEAAADDVGSAARDLDCCPRRL